MKLSSRVSENVRRALSDVESRLWSLLSKRISDIFSLMAFDPMPDADPEAPSPCFLGIFASLLASLR